MEGGFLTPSTSCSILTLNTSRSLTENDADDVFKTNAGLFSLSLKDSTNVLINMPTSFLS